MTMNVEEVRKIAKLSKLPLTAEEENKIQVFLGTALDYLEILNGLKTDSIDTAATVHGLVNVMAEDGARTPTTLSVKEALSGTASIKDDCFKTKGVFTD